MCESYKQLLIVYDIKIVVTFYQILIINPCVSDGNPITSWHVQVVIRVVKCVIQKKKKKVTKGTTHLIISWYLGIWVSKHVKIIYFIVINQQSLGICTTFTWK